MDNSIFQRGSLQWDQVDGGYKQIIEQVELQRLEAHAKLVMARALGQRVVDQRRREYNVFAMQVALLTEDYKEWRSKNPEPERPKYEDSIVPPMPGLPPLSDLEFENRVE